MPVHSPNPQPYLDPLHLAALERIERNLDRTLRQLRAYRQEQQLAGRDQGVLGSRGLTQYILDMLRTIHDTNLAAGAPTPIIAGLHITAIMIKAEQAGFALPTKLVLRARLSERSYRVGDIAWRRGETGTQDGFWYWRG